MFSVTRIGRRTLWLALAAGTVLAVPSQADPVDDIRNTYDTVADETRDPFGTIAIPGPVPEIMGKITIKRDVGDRAPSATLHYSFTNGSKWTCTGSFGEFQPVIVECTPKYGGWKCINVVTAETTTEKGKARGRLDCDGVPPPHTSTATVSGAGNKDVKFGVFGMDAIKVTCIADDGSGGAPIPGYVVTCGA